MLMTIPAYGQTNSQPFTIDDVLQLIAAKVPPERVLSEARTHCLAFSLDSDTQLRLFQAGAGPAVVNGLKTVCRAQTPGATGAVAGKTVSADASGAAGSRPAIASPPSQRVGDRSYGLLDVSANGCTRRSDDSKVLCRLSVEAVPKVSEFYDRNRFQILDPVLIGDDFAPRNAENAKYDQTTIRFTPKGLDASFFKLEDGQSLSGLLVFSDRPPVGNQIEITLTIQQIRDDRDHPVVGHLLVKIPNVPVQ